MDEATSKLVDEAAAAEAAVDEAADEASKLYELREALADDVHSIITPYPKLRDTPQRDRRVLVRCFFAAVEGMTFAAKQDAARIGERRRTLTHAELALCREEDYELSDHGEALIKFAKLRFKSNVRFSFLVFPKSFGGSYKPNYGDAGWHKLCQSVPVRDRLTHPKRVSDLFVSDAEIALAVAGYNWFGRATTTMLSEYVAVLTEENTQLEERMRARDEAAAKYRIGWAAFDDPGG